MYDMGDMPVSLHPILRWHFRQYMVDRMIKESNLEIEYLTEDERELLEQLRKSFDN